jgi:putative MATE family efflux protein
VTPAERSGRRRHDREILALAVPALGALVAEPLYVLADTAVVGRLGTVPLAGLAAANGVLVTLFAVFIFLAYGTTASVARLLGAGEDRRAAHHAVQAIWLALALGTVVGVLGFVAAPWLLGLLGATGAVLDEALVYLRVSLSGVPAMLVVYAGTGYLRGLQDTRTPFVVAVGSATANLVIECVLIFGLGYGIGASALSTVIAQWSAAGLYLWWVARAVRRHAVSLRPDRRAVGDQLVVGRDLLVRTIALRAAFVASVAVAARFGPTSLAAHQISIEIWTFLALVLDAVAIAGQALTGRHLGAGDAAEARAVGRRMIEWGVAAGVVLGVGLAATHTVVPAVFSTDEAVRALTASLLLIAAAMQPLNGAVFALDGILIGAGDLRFLAVAMVISIAAFVPLAVGVAVADLGVTWLWGALAVFMAARAVTLGLRFTGDRWLVTGATR